MKKTTTIKYADKYNIGELSDAIVDNFIKKIREKNSSQLEKENYRHPLSECTGTKLESSNSQENENVADEIKWNIKMSHYFDGNNLILYFNWLIVLLFEF